MDSTKTVIKYTRTNVKKNKIYKYIKYTAKCRKIHIRIYTKNYSKSEK